MAWNPMGIEHHLADLMVMRTALGIAASSPCHKAKYGAIIIGADGKMLAYGVNQKPFGSCNVGECYRLRTLPREERSECCLHAEHNAMHDLRYHQTVGGTLYVTSIPCERCALEIMDAGIVRVVYINDHNSSGALRRSTPEFWQRFGQSIELVPLDEDEVKGGDDGNSNHRDLART